MTQRIIGSSAGPAMWSRLIGIYHPYAIKGDTQSQFELAEIWLHDLRSPTLAKYWYRRAARKDHPEAAAQYAMLLLKQSPPDYAGAHYWSLRASIKGSARGRLIAAFVRRIRARMASVKPQQPSS